MFTWKIKNHFTIVYLYSEKKKWISSFASKCLSSAKTTSDNDYVTTEKTSSYMKKVNTLSSIWYMEKSYECRTILKSTTAISMLSSHI